MKELKFIHITKTGGTSIENLGRKFNINWGRFDLDVTENYATLKNIPFWHKPLYLFSKYPYLNNDVFLIVRNPYERIISEFHCNYFGYNGCKCRKVKINNKDEFNNFIREKILTESLIKTSNGHWLPQHIYLRNLKNKVNILKYENLKEDFENLMLKYKLDLVLNLHDNKSKKNFNINDLDIITISMINKIYHKDFVVFNYPKITF